MQRKSPESQEPRAILVNPAREINMISKPNQYPYIYHFSIIRIHLASFYPTKYFWKKKKKREEMLIEQIIEFELRAWSYMFSYNLLFL